MMRLALSLLAEIMSCCVFVLLPATMNVSEHPVDPKSTIKIMFDSLLRPLIPPETIQAPVTLTELPPFMMYGVQESGRSPYRSVYLVIQS